MKGLRIDSTKALLPFLFQRKSETRKKEEQQETAKKATLDQFASFPPPSLKIVENDSSYVLRR